MNCVIPYTKEIEFATKIAEISSISLEHEISVNKGELLGNFIISGDYKAHEVSVNKEEFSYTLPFSISLADNIDEETIDFSITDFSYEIINENTLKIFVEFRVVASEKENKANSEELFQPVEEIPKNDVIVEDKEERIEENDTQSILNNINDNDDYTMYHIHIVKEGETVETIATMYNSNIDLINDYNDLTAVTTGDKLIIPEECNE